MSDADDAAFWRAEKERLLASATRYAEAARAELQSAHARGDASAPTHATMVMGEALEALCAIVAWHDRKLRERELQGSWVKALPLLPDAGQVDGVELAAFGSAVLRHYPVRPALVLGIAVTGDLGLVSARTLRIGDLEFAEYGFTRLELAAPLRGGRRVIVLPETRCLSGVPIQIEVSNSSKRQVARVAAAAIVRVPAPGERDAS